MSIISNIRLVLACVLFLLAGFVASASSTDPGDKNTKKETKQYEYKKKSIYYEIRAELEAGDLTLEEAQKKWQKELKKLEKREGK